MSHVYPAKTALRQSLSTLQKFCGALLVFTVLGCATTGEHIMATQESKQALFFADGTPASTSDLLNQTFEANFILVGESHDNAFDHIWQAQILEALAKAGQNPVLGLEMVDKSNQDVLEQFYQAKISLTDLELALNWSKTWGYAFALYRPIFEIAQKYHIPLIALNVPRELLKKVAEQGFEVVKAEQPDLLPARILPPPSLQEQELKIFFEQHAKALEKMKRATPPSLENFLRTQSLWDTAMAENAIGAHQKWQRPVLILAGNGHVEYGFGIASRLHTLLPTAKVVIMSPIRDEQVAILHRQKNQKNSTAVSPTGTGEEAEKAAEMRPALGDFLFYTGQGRTKK